MLEQLAIVLITREELQQLIASCVKKAFNEEHKAEKMSSEPKSEKAKKEKTAFTTTEAAEYLGITRSYLYKLMMWRKVSYYKPRGKLCFFEKSDLDEYMFSYKVKSEDELSAESETYMLRRRMRNGL